MEGTYPERRVSQQMTDDLLLVYLDRGRLPEGVTLVLRPNGKYRVPRSRSLRSRNHSFPPSSRPVSHREGGRKEHGSPNSLSAL